MPLNSPLSVYLKRAAFLCVGYYLGIGLTPLLSSSGERTRSQRHNTPDYHAGMGTHASESALRAVVPWSGNASLAQILKYVKPGFGGNPALSVLAVKEGFLDNFSENPNGEAAEIIQIALGEDPEGVSEYLSMALKRGKLAYLSDRAPLPPVSSPVYSKLVSAYLMLSKTNG